MFVLAINIILQMVEWLNLSPILHRYKDYIRYPLENIENLPNWNIRQVKYKFRFIWFS